MKKENSKSLYIGFFGDVFATTSNTIFADHILC